MIYLHLKIINQISCRNELSNIKFGEENKTKEYIALCRSKTELSEELIENINKIEKLDIEQKTPIRVLHRRPLAVRTKTIHKINAKLVPGKFCLLHFKDKNVKILF